MSRKTLLVALITLAGVAGGKALVSAQPLPSRKISGTSALGSQLLGGMRAVVLISLWNDIDDARNRGKWFKEFALYAALEEAAPNNPNLPRAQAEHECTRVADHQPSRELAWEWTKRGMERYHDARTRLPERAEIIDASEWFVIWARGMRFPGRMAQLIGQQMGEEGLERLASDVIEEIDASPRLVQFLEDHYFNNEVSSRLYVHEGDEEWEYFALDESRDAIRELRALPLVDQNTLKKANLLRWYAAERICRNSFARATLPNSNLASCLVRTLIQIKANMGAGADAYDDRIRSVVAMEMDRLEAMGEHKRASDFRKWFLAQFAASTNSLDPGGGEGQ